MIQLNPAPLQQTKLTPVGKSEATIWGIVIAAAIAGIWASSLFLLLSIDISNTHVLIIFLAILLQTFLYTGLFITAHDAMHGVAVPKNNKINNLVGSLALLLYGLMSYKKLLKKHWLHHHNPASQLDPDFHNGQDKNFFAWYFHFMKGYWSWTQIIGLMMIFNLATYTLNLPENNLILFWIIPPILSSAQLFYFGTFIPHREPQGGYSNSHRAQSSPRPVLLSFITCYHFGYHEEHHECPNVPWWQLPAIHYLRKSQTIPQKEVLLQ